MTSVSHLSNHLAKRWHLAFALVTLVSCFVATPSLSAAEGPCAADRKAFCKDYKGAWRKCLKDNFTSLSQGCRDSLGKGAKAKVEGATKGALGGATDAAGSVTKKLNDVGAGVKGTDGQ